MSGVLSNSIVIIAIVVSAGYAVWRLGPRKMRDALRARLRTTLPRVFGNLSDTSSGGACDACGGGCAPTTKNAPAPRKEHAVLWRKSTR
ncbi:MAG TPA: hypothetical protein VJT10_02685 [Steroidobacteraceae bacterium]|nr:hypothetical protein [Steroidobacteraceae bacterium]